MQGVYWFLVLLNLPLFAIAIWKPRWALWGGILLGALLLPWQTAENRKWAQIHEEVTGIIQFAETEQNTFGDYPDNLSNYDFQRGWTEKHISYSVEGDGYRLSYFMDNANISYWYHSEEGFGYYPD
ncbi:MAG: hypothetical protein AAFX78_08670 [Cyanobacteria bacterium J06638_20]